MLRKQCQTCFSGITGKILGPATTIVNFPGFTGADKLPVPGNGEIVGIGL